MNDEENPTIVLIVANSAIVRVGLETVLRQKSDFVIAGAAAELTTTAPAFSTGENADVILVNVERESDYQAFLQFLGGNSNEINAPSVVALFPAEMQNAQYTLRALQHGARGILPHEATASEIIAAISAAANDLITLLPQLVENLLIFSMASDASNSLIESNQNEFPSESVEHLTPRETEILEMLADGASNKAIAYQLDISEHTVKFHVASIFGKFGVNTRTEAVTQGLRRGLILL